MEENTCSIEQLHNNIAVYHSAIRALPFNTDNNFESYYIAALSEAFRLAVLDEEQGVDAFARTMYLLLNANGIAEHEQLFHMLTHETLRSLRMLHSLGLQNPCQQSEENWYALATVVMADAFYMDAEKPHSRHMAGKMLSQLFKVPNIVLEEDSNDHYCGQIGEMFFGPVWRSLFANNITGLPDIVREVWQARPPIEPSNGFRPLQRQHQNRTADIPGGLI